MASSDPYESSSNRQVHNSHDYQFRSNSGNQRKGVLPGSPTKQAEESNADDFVIVPKANAIESLIDAVSSLVPLLEPANKSLCYFKRATAAEIYQIPHKTDTADKIKIEDLQRKLDEANKSTAHEKQRTERYAKNTDFAEKQKEELQKKVNELKSIIKEEKNALMQYETDQRSKEDSYKKQILELDHRLQETKNELEETKTRLSRMMGNKLSDNNPNITDLSDRNRPSKLGEKFQELYDNQWTDAFEVADQYYQTETECVAVLLKILLAAKRFCEAESVKQEQKVKDALFVTYKSKPLPDVVNKQVKDCRKAMATENVDTIYRNFLVQTPDHTKIGALTHKVKDYVRECVTICWFMTLQDPPVVFGPNVNSQEEFDTNVYRHYTLSGKLIDFVVWPPVYLYQGGPILTKGVAQGFKVRTPPRPQSERRNRSDDFNVEKNLRRPHSAEQPTTKYLYQHGHVNTGERVRPSDRLFGKNRVVERNLAATLNQEYDHRRNANYDQTTMTSQQNTAPKSEAKTADYKNYMEPTEKELAFCKYNISRYGEKATREVMKERFDVCLNYLAMMH